MAETKEIKKVAKPRAKKPHLAEASRGDFGFAIIETGGKQYRVAIGDTIKIEKVNKELKAGDSLVFDKVLLVDNGADITDIGTPYLEGVKVSGTLVEIGRNPKVVVIKYKQKSRYFKRNTHRQPYFKVKIDSIK